MAQNARGITQECAFLGLKYLILIFDPYFPKKCQILPQNSNFKPKWWNMKVQVYQKLLNHWTWKFDTMLRTWNILLRCNMMTSQQIQYGGRPPYWKSSFGYISAICSFNAKFCAKKQNHVQTQVTDQNTKFWKFKMVDDRHFENGFRYISAGNHPISMKFGVQTQNLVPRTVACWSIKKCMKFKMADSRHIENRLLAISSYCPIDAIFDMYK